MASLAINIYDNEDKAKAYLKQATDDGKIAEMSGPYAKLTVINAPGSSPELFYKEDGSSWVVRVVNK